MVPCLGRRRASPPAVECKIARIVRPLMFHVNQLLAVAASLRKFGGNDLGSKVVEPDNDFAGVFLFEGSPGLIKRHLGPLQSFKHKHNNAINRRQNATQHRTEHG